MLLLVIFSNGFWEVPSPLKSYQLEVSLSLKLPCGLDKWTLCWKECGVVPGVNIRWRKPTNSTFNFFNFMMDMIVINTCEDKVQQYYSVLLQRSAPLYNMFLNSEFYMFHCPCY